MEPAPTPPSVNLSNWRQSPQNRGSFRRLPSEIATARVASDPSSVTSFARSAKSIDGFALRLPNGATLDLDAFHTATSTDAMLVLQHGKLIYETYRNGMTSASRHIVMSATKAVIGLLTEILGYEGAIDCSADVTRFVPEMAGSPYAGATIRHLLDMRASVVFDEVQEKAYARATGWEPDRNEKSGLQAFFANLEGRAPDHGGPFRYVSANTDLLGWALERAASRPIPQLLSERLWTRIGAEQDALLTLDPAGSPRCTGGLCATIGDFARLGHLVAMDGRRNQRQIFPNSIIEGLVRGGDRQAWRDGQWGAAFAPISTSMSHRSGWYTMDGKPQILFAMGVHGQNLFVDRDHQIVVAKFSSWAQPTDNRALWLTHAAVAEIRRCLEG